ncbi:hypothetical protein CDO52_24800 [Nocardiopsis gilva YIM 90087]|uniref:Serine/arginine repetitive matrix protein 2 n=1 Tax=Nocardiopsis gilva YIM 90087 TaxID=1235441 RepID=A0A223SBW4_9ACTN|nr:hypothetical protein [Nocardiopsis gilva]ASU85592.1 hypothetical protein CDO52_24800 [Nocardiopsis gilva YIM 90087]
MTGHDTADHDTAVWDAEEQCWTLPDRDDLTSETDRPDPAPTPLGTLPYRAVGLIPETWTKPQNRVRLLAATGGAIVLLVGGVAVLTDTSEDESDGGDAQVATPPPEVPTEDADVNGGLDNQQDEEHGSPSTEQPEEQPTSSDAYQLIDDPQGFALYVPESWTRSQDEDEEAGAIYTAPDDERYLLQVMWEDDSTDSPEEILERRVRQTASENDGYEEVSFGEAAGAGPAEIEYTYDHKDHGPRRVMAAALTPADDTTYIVLSVGPEDDRTAIDETLRKAVTSFQQ